MIWIEIYDFSERGVGPCDPLDLPENADKMIYHEPKPTQKKFAKIAEALCANGYFPDLSQGKKLKTVCKIVKDKKTGEMKYKWIRPLPKCITCDLQPGADLNNKIQAGISDPLGADVFCSLNSKFNSKSFKKSSKISKISIHKVKISTCM